MRFTYDASALEALNAAIAGIIYETRSVKDVCDVVNRSQETAGRPHGVPPRAVESALAIIRGCLRTRLRESASDAIFFGCKTGVDEEHLDRLARSLSDAKACGYLDDELNFREFDHLLRNLQVRTEASSAGKDSSMAFYLVKQLKSCVKASTPEEKEVSLTDTTITVICFSLLRMIHGNPQACEACVNLNLVGLIDKLALGNPEYREHQPEGAPEHPELQLCLAHILGEIAVQGAQQAREQKAASSRITDLLGPKQGGGSKLGMQLSPEAQKAIDILIQMFDGFMKRDEHAGIWATTCALDRVAQDKTGCNRMLIGGLLPLLKQALTYYEGVHEDMPLPGPRPRPQQVFFSDQPPSFVGGGRQTAMLKCNDTVKDRWLRQSESLPELSTLKRDKRSSVDWLAGTPAMAPGRRQSGKSWLASDLPRSRTLRVIEAAGPPGAPLLRARGVATNSDPISSLQPKVKDVPGAEPYPSLMWLINEGGVTSDAFYRVCNKNMVLLQIHRLLRSMEQERQNMAAPFVGNIKAKERARQIEKKVAKMRSTR
eukprot:gnl/TRDRNA2_/TRDRNA2_37784_c0_seq1.p1 gnl/TRDRNA2_/TRDRNA2_37784_c0~~gnl/TRDRNA2_/TRDRNA2_37784_c0_seq1.p1  ORF type:complete len:543 (-),score=102.83 gnl/TRDRNA2_/TRDRNA2_37784_c0_seq1:217-1845(-)